MKKVIGIILMAILILPVVYSATVSHDASQVLSGTFGSGNFIFPLDLTIKGFFHLNHTMGMGNITSCSDGEIYKIVGGVWACASDNSAAGGDPRLGGAPYLYNDSTTIYINSSYLNGTIDARDADTHATTLPSDNITMDVLGTPTYTTLQQWTDTTQSAGIISGGNFSANADGTLNISAVKGFIKTTNDQLGNTMFFDWVGNESVTLTDQDTNYIYIDYNGGTLKAGVTLTRSDIHFTDQVGLGRVYRDGTTLKLLEGGINVLDATRMSHKRLVATEGFTQSSGLQISETGTLNILMSAGKFWNGNTEFSASAYNSSQTNFTYWYNNGTWQSRTDDAIDTTNYNDYGAEPGLVALTASQYGVHWVYLHYDGSIAVVYGLDSYKLAEAQAEPSPANLPDVVKDFSGLIAKVIILKSEASTFTEVTTPWETLIAGGTVTSYNSLSDLPDLTVYPLLDGSRPLTANWDVGSFNITAEQFLGSLNWSYLLNVPADIADGDADTQNDTDYYVTSLELSGTTTKTIELVIGGESIANVSTTFTDLVNHSDTNTQNNTDYYVTAINVSGTTTKNLTLTRDGLSILSILFTDIDTTIANCSASNSCPNILYELELNTISELNTQIADATLLISGGTLTNAKWCIYDGTGIDCNVEPVSDTDTHITSLPWINITSIPINTICNQDTNTTSAVTFATVDTGYGANELYDMDQNVLTTSPVHYVNVTSKKYQLANSTIDNIYTETWNGTCVVKTFVWGAKDVWCP